MKINEIVDASRKKIPSLFSPTVFDRKPFPRAFLRSQEAFPYPAGFIVPAIKISTEYDNVVLKSFVLLKITNKTLCKIKNN